MYGVCVETSVGERLDVAVQVGGRGVGVEVTCGPQEAMEKITRKKEKTAASRPRLCGSVKG